MVETTGTGAGQGAVDTGGKPEPAGKPNGSRAGGAGKANGVDIESASGTGTGKPGDSGSRRPGVRAGSKRGPYAKAPETGKGERPAASPKVLDVDALSRLLVSFNLGLSIVTKTPELLLSEDEAKLCTDSYANLARFYPSIGIPEKTAAWLDFLSTFGGIYGSKILAANVRRKGEAKNPAPRPGVIAGKPVTPTPSATSATKNPYDLPPHLKGNGQVKAPPKTADPKEFLPAAMDIGNEPDQAE